MGTLNLKKGILLIGTIDVGKSMLANIIMDGKKQITINGRDNHLLESLFMFSDCSIDTEIIHIDDLLDLKKLELFFNAITNGVEVDKRGQKSFTIYPQIIISINCKMKDLEFTASLTRRFDVFQLSACRTNFIPLKA